MKGTVVHIVENAHGRSGLIANADDPEAKWAFFTPADCICHPDDVLSCLGAEVSFDIDGSDPIAKHPRAIGVRAFASKTYEGVIDNVVSDAGKNFGFLHDAWNDRFYFTAKHTSHFSALHKGLRIRFSIMHANDKRGNREIAHHIEPIEDQHHAE